MAESVKKRSEIEKAYTWKLEFSGIPEELSDI